MSSLSEERKFSTSTCFPWVKLVEEAKAEAPKAKEIEEAAASGAKAEAPKASDARVKVTAKLERNARVKVARAKVAAWLGKVARVKVARAKVATRLERNPKKKVQSAKFAAIMEERVIEEENAFGMALESLRSSYRL